MESFLEQEGTVQRRVGLGEPGQLRGPAGDEVLRVLDEPSAFSTSGDIRPPPRPDDRGIP
jgi:hypothetical protein